MGATRARLRRPLRAAVARQSDPTTVADATAHGHRAAPAACLETPATRAPRGATGAPLRCAINRRNSSNDLRPSPSKLTIKIIPSKTSYVTLPPPDARALAFLAARP